MSTNSTSSSLFVYFNLKFKLIHLCDEREREIDVILRMFCRIDKTLLHITAPKHYKVVIKQTDKYIYMFVGENDEYVKFRVLLVDLIEITCLNQPLLNIRIQYV